MIYNRKWKRRHGVLGYWHELKLKMWAEHIKECERGHTEDEKYFNSFDIPSGYNRYVTDY
jgi:hypothetical protein